MTKTTGNPTELPDAAWRRRFRRRLRSWYAKHARNLPWRGLHDPYAIWVSEIMLQQTQVATVEGYFERFMQAFPTIEALAAADEHDVLRLWEGLGYYRRARQLHRAAKIVFEQHGGEFPRDARDAARLPGVGRYTAGAVLSIAFDAREPILEANTVRLFSRLLGYGGDPASVEGRELLWAMAALLLPRRDVGTLNQAMMELGARVCLPRRPPCDACPVASLCEANSLAAQSRIPRFKPKRRSEAVREAAVVIRRRSRVLLVRCADDGRWAGLWDFPRFALRAKRPDALRRELIDKVRRQTGVTVAPGAHLGTIKHGVTRFRITLDCYEAEYVSSADGNGVPAPMKWLRPGELEDYPLNVTGRKLSRMMM